MKVFLIRQKKFGLILLGILFGLGFWSGRISLLQTVLAPPKKIIIGIDPGHGGIDPGTKWGKMLEKDLNLSFSQKLGKG